MFAVTIENCIDKIGINIIIRKGENGIAFYCKDIDNKDEYIKIGKQKLIDNDKAST